MKKEKSGFLPRQFSDDELDEEAMIWRRGVNRADPQGKTRRRMMATLLWDHGKWGDE